jgi:hypothetical protein
MYTRVGRSAPFWLALCAALAVLLLAYPETVVLVVQAIFLGGVFSLVSALTRWLLSSEGQSRIIAAAPPASSVGSLAATQAWVSDSAESDGAVASAPSFHTSGSAS